MVDVLSQLSPDLIMHTWKEDVDVIKLLCYIKFGKKPNA